MNSFNIAEFLLNNSIGLLVCIVLMVALRSNNFKKIKAGKDGIEIENKTEADKFEVIDPKDKCPHEAAYSAAREATSAVGKRVDAIESALSLLKAQSDALLAASGEIAASQKEIALNQFLQVFRNPAMPMDERLVSGMTYIQKGGNSYTKIAVIDMSVACLDKYEAICSGRPDLRIQEIESNKHDLEKQFIKAAEDAFKGKAPEVVQGATYGL